MKKIFLAAMTALALCSYSYAQDDDYEEEDSPRAVATAPVQSQSAAKAVDGEAFMGVSLDLLGFLNGDLQRFGLVFRLAPNMELSAQIGLAIIGDEDGEDENSKKVDGSEGYTQISLGAGFDFFVATILLPISIGGDFIFTHYGEDNNALTFDVMFGMRAEIIKNFTINGKVGMLLNYHWWSSNRVDWNRVDFGLAARVNFIWFFL